MKNIKQQFQEFRSSTPKHIQWLLLAAAFIIVVILLFLIFSHKSDNNEKIESANQEISFDVQPKSIDFKDVIVGESDNQNVSISVNLPVILDSITIDVTDITTTDNCDNLTDSCLINVIYKPHMEHDVTQTTLNIMWHTSSDNVIRTEYIPVVYSAHNTLVPVEEEPKPIIEPEPVVEPIVEPEIVDSETNDEEYYEPIADTVVDEIETIMPDEVFDEPEPVFDPMPIADALPEPTIQTPEFLLPPEKCSDFAIPGYNQSGIQIGWIKPERGANYFYPFADKDCTHPTGKYDFSTGIITSLTDGSRIGTDANHIGYRNIRDAGLSLPALSDPIGRSSQALNGAFQNAVWQPTSESTMNTAGGIKRWSKTDEWKRIDTDALLGSAETEESVTSSRPFDRTFILRQFKPIPATIVSEVRADPSVYGCDKSGQNCEQGKNYSVPVRATVDRNVFSDDGRTIIIPTGTLLMGYLEGDLPGPYQAVGRMNIRWYQFIRPDGVEFNFGNNQDPYSGDAQGRMGVPGHGSTDYIEQMVMPILTSLVPAAVNMIAPIADTVINQINLDSNTIVQSGTMRSSEMAKQEVIDTWNKVAQKLLVDVMSNTTPPFSIAAGTRINVFSPVDLIVTCDKSENAGKKCAFTTYSDKKRREWSSLKQKVTSRRSGVSDSEWVGQVRSFNLMKYCNKDQKTGKLTIDDSTWMQSGYDYRTVYAYCESQNYQAINNAKQAAYNQSVKETAEKKYGTTTFNKTTGEFSQTAETEDQIKAYNQDVLGLQYDDQGAIINPFAKPASVDVVAEEGNALTCDDNGTLPDQYGCCPGETYTDMGPMDSNAPDGPHEFACCPAGDGDCFPPIEVE